MQIKKQKGKAKLANEVCHSEEESWKRSDIEMDRAIDTLTDTSFISNSIQPGKIPVTNTFLYLPQILWGYYQTLIWSQLAMDC